MDVEGLKKVTLMLLLLVILVVPVNAAYAQETTDANDVTQAELDQRLEIVFDYLSTYAKDVEFNGQHSLVYDIPVGNGAIVTAEISNTKAAEMSARTFYGESHTYVEPNQSYNFTLTLSNLVNSGDVTKFVTNYTTTTPLGNQTYVLRVNSVAVTGQPTGLYRVDSKYSTIGINNSNIVTVGAYIKYSHPTLSTKTISLNTLDIGSLVNGRVNYMYNYDVY